MGGRKKIEEWQKQFIYENYLNIPIKTMARQIGLGETLVRSRIQQWGLIIPPELAEKRKKASCFKKGHKPANKGVKGLSQYSQKAIEGMKKGWFKRGHKPKNTITDTKLSQRKDSNGRKYWWYKISDGHWDLYHRYIWEQEHGGVPENHIIVFKDSNPDNVQLSNLECISKGEHARRNKEGYYKNPEHIKRNLSLTYKLQEKIKSYEKE